MSLSLLNLGCGSFIHDDWTNVDFVSNDKRVIAHNLLLGVPFETNSFDAVYHSHVLEHFSKADAPHFIKECHRVLKPGGWVRIVVPDFELLCKEYLKWLDLASEGNEEAEQNYDWIMIEMLDQIARNEPGGEMALYLRQENIPNKSYVEERIGTDVRDKLISSSNSKSMLKSIKLIIRQVWNRILYIARKLLGKPYKYYKIGKFRMSGENHQWMYDKYSLSKLLLQTGFKNIQIKTAIESNIVNYEVYSLDTYKGKARGMSSIFIEAQKL